MNWERIEVNWRQFKTDAKREWGKLSEAQLDGIAGKRLHLSSRLQDAYGYTKDEAEQQVSAWQNRQKDRSIT